MTRGEKDYKKMAVPYTTTIDVNKTISEVNKILASLGISNISFNYNTNGRIDSVTFSVDSPEGRITYKLPVDWTKVLSLLNKAKIPIKYKNNEQAERVAWRALLHWLKAQIALLSIRMVEPEQVFLPYMTSDDGRTLYEHYLEKRSRFQALGKGDIK